MIGAGTGKHRIILCYLEINGTFEKMRVCQMRHIHEFIAHKVGEYLATADLYRLLSNDAPLVACLALYWFCLHLGVGLYEVCGVLSVR